MPPPLLSAESTPGVAPTEERWLGAGGRKLAASLPLGGFKLSFGHSVTSLSLSSASRTALLRAPPLCLRGMAQPSQPRCLCQVSVRVLGVGWHGCQAQESWARGRGGLECWCPERGMVVKLGSRRCLWNVTICSLLIRGNARRQSRRQLQPPGRDASAHPHPLEMPPSAALSSCTAPTQVRGGEWGGQACLGCRGARHGADGHCRSQWAAPGCANWGCLRRQAWGSVPGHAWIRLFLREAPSGLCCSAPPPPQHSRGVVLGGRLVPEVLSPRQSLSVTQGEQPSRGRLSRLGQVSLLACEGRGRALCVGRAGDAGGNGSPAWNC